MFYNSCLQANKKIISQRKKNRRVEALPAPRRELASENTAASSKMSFTPSLAETAPPIFGDSPRESCKHSAWWLCLSSPEGGAAAPTAVSSCGATKSSKRVKSLCKKGHESWDISCPS